MATNTGFVQVPAQSKNLDTAQVTTDEGLVHRQVVCLADPETPTTYARVTGTSLNANITNASLSTVITSSVLPTGASTSANQTTTHNKLDTINTSIGTSNTELAAVNTKLAGVIDVDVTSSVLPTGASTSANQTTTHNKLDTINTSIGTSNTELAAVNTKLAGVIDVDVTSSVLPTGASTSANQTTTHNKLDTISNKLGSVVNATLSTATALNASATFTSSSVDVSAYDAIVVSLLTDQNGTLYIDQSTNGTNWDNTNSFAFSANASTTHTVQIVSAYARVRITNTAASNQTFLRAQTLLSYRANASTPLNKLVLANEQAINVRPSSFNMLAAAGLLAKKNVVFKDGLNLDIDIGSTPEDVTNDGGVYAGFASSAAASEIVVSGADTGTVYYEYLESDTSTDYVIGSKAVTGAGTYSLGHNIWRCNFAYFVKSSFSSSNNVGVISIRQTATPTTVFCEIDIGYGQSFCAAYTVPYNAKIYIQRISGNIRGSTSGTLDCVFFVRDYNSSPVYILPFELQFGSQYVDDADYMIMVQSRADIVPRIINSSTSNLSAKVSYRFLQVKD